MEAKLSGTGHIDYHLRHNDWKGGIEVIHYGKPDSLYGAIRTPVDPNLSPEIKRVDLPADDWFTLEVIADGPRLITKTNGVTTSDVTLTPEQWSKAYKHGVIAIAAGPAKGTWTIRKIEIKELPPEEPGWVQLFNGKDLTGWNNAPWNKAQWTVEEGNFLVAKGGPAMLLATKTFQNFHCRMEAKITETTWGTLAVRRIKGDEGIATAITMIANRTGGIWQAGENTTMLFEPDRPAAIAPDSWTTVEIIARGASVTVLVNGIKTCEKTIDSLSKEGRLVLGQSNADGVFTVRKIEIKELPPSVESRPPLAALLKDAVLVMNFEKETFYEKDGKTYVRDLSSKGNDGLCERVKFSPEGKAGGGLAIPEGGHLRLPRSLLNKQPEYTVAAWVRVDDPLMEGRFPRYLYSERDRRDFKVPLYTLDGGTSSDRRLRVNPWNIARKPDPWKAARLDRPVYPFDRWFFLAVTLRGGGVDRGDLLFTVDDQTYSLTSQMLDTPLEVVGILGGNFSGALDEVAIFQRALSAAEIAELRRPGLAGKPLGVSPPPAIAPFDAKQAKAHQEAWAKHLGMPVEYTNSIGMKLRLIPPGKFLMGSTKEEIEKNTPKDANPWAKDALMSEVPQREVVIDRPFFLGMHEVTVGQFRQFVKETGYKTTAEKTGNGVVWDVEQNEKVAHRDHIWSNPRFAQSEEHPVVFVSQLDAEAFCAWLSKKDGRRYVIPREDQWEYACRAGTTTSWWTGNTFNDLIKKESVQKAPMHAVGALSKSPFGLFDMHGNAGELCLDADDAGVNRGAKGYLTFTRSAARQTIKDQDNASYQRGFRVALVGELTAKSALEED